MARLLQAILKMTVLLQCIFLCNICEQMRKTLHRVMQCAHCDPCFVPVVLSAFIFVLKGFQKTQAYGTACETITHSATEIQHDMLKQNPKR